MRKNYAFFRAQRRATGHSIERLTGFEDRTRIDRENQCYETRAVLNEILNRRRVLERVDSGSRILFHENDANYLLYIYPGSGRAYNKVRGTDENLEGRATIRNSGE